MGFPSRQLVFTKHEYIKLINLYNGKKDCFTSIYSGIQPEVEVDKIFFDLDSVRAYDDIVALTEQARQHSYIYTNIFSGGGFHHYRWVTPPTNKKIAVREYQNALENLLGIKIDPVIKGDLARLARIPCTFNIKRNRFCIPLTNEDIELGYRHILQKAKTYKRLPIKIYGNTSVVLDEYDNEENHSPRCREVRLNIKTSLRPCIQTLIQEMQEKQRHFKNHLLNLAVAVEMCTNGYSDTDVHTLFSVDSEYDPVITQRQIDSLRLLPHRCQTLQEYGICLHEECRFFVNFRAK